MPREIEAKLKIDSHTELRERLVACGAVYQGKVLETNRLFDTPDGRLRGNDCGLRIRACRCESGPQIQPTLTYKGTRGIAHYKSREEIQIGIDDADTGILLLTAIGFIEIVRFEKWRETWHLGGCHVELDEIPHLGCYVEIEGPDEPAVSAVQKLLVLDHLPHEPRSYIALLTEDRQQNEQPLQIFCFPVGPR